MKNSIRNLIITLALISGIFGIAKGETEISGEFSSDVTFGDATAFSTPYTGLNISGDGWELSTNLSGGNVNVEEAKYSWSISNALQQHLVVRQNHMESHGVYTDLQTIHMYLLQEIIV